MPSLNRTRAATRELAATERDHEALLADLDRVLALIKSGQVEAADRLQADTHRRQRALVRRQRNAWRNASRVAHRLETRRRTPETHTPGCNRPRERRGRAPRRRAVSHSAPTRGDPSEPPLHPFEAELDACDELGLVSLGDKGQP
jgi:hypothetical protein